MALSVGDVAGDTSTLTSDWIAATLRHLHGTQRSRLNLLAADLGHDITEVPFSYDLTDLQEGALISIDLEVMYVWAVNTSAKTATVQRAMQGSTAAAHAQGALVNVNPQFTDWEIFDALNRELRSLASPTNGLFQIRTLDLTAIAGQEGYDFDATGFLSIADIRYQDFGTVSQDWPEVTDYTLSFNMPAPFTSGTALFLDSVPAQQPIRIRYRSEFTPLDGLTMNVEDTGLPASAFDIPPIGAAIIVMSGRPIERADTSRQGDTRRAGEVSTGDVTGATAALRALRAQRITEEAARLSELWPQRSRTRVTL